ncbi:hypothetical protein QQS21_007046 [Conoideocrella luteorostrata]|uniref:Uncharacterized protein n=1 Tax=Conoideocrella luteorostrata TaxID=1105319 RepID=A0AAJ0FXF4_9HYPO|nr:hypothetical protein QQS21_007046 [Conoideocrella luteorostrata]
MYYHGRVHRHDPRPLEHHLGEPFGRAIWENLDGQAALIIEMETEVGINNLDAIPSAVGCKMDVVWTGLIDLRVSMGLDGIWGKGPDFLRTIQLVANKTLAVVCGDWLALTNKRGTIRSGRTNPPPTDKRQIER